MAKLPNKRREFLNRIAKELLILLGSSTLAAGLFMTAITMFSIPYGINTWNKGGVSDGAANVWNTIADTLGKSNYILIRKYDTAGGDCGTFLTLVLIGLMIVCYLIFKSRNLLLVLIPAVPLLVFSIGFGIYPSAVSVTILVTGLATQVIHGNMGERFGLTGVIMVICSVAFILPFAATGTGLSLIEKPYALKKIADSAYEKTGLLRYGRDTLGNGDMITDKRSGKTKALSVKMEKPHPMYLRGFVGENFDGRRWIPLDKELHYESLPVFKGLGKANFNARGQLADAARIAGMKENGGKVEIETIGASRLYAYTPYEITGKKPAGTKDWSGAFLTGDGLRGVNSYSYTAGEDLTSVWTDVAGKLYSSEESERIKKYSAAESHYNVFAYKNYTFLTDSQVETLADEIGTRGNQEKGHIVDLGAVDRQVLPVLDEAVGAEVADGGQEEGQPGRRRRGVDGDEKVLVLGLGQVLEGGRRGLAVLGEPGGVDVDADLPEVDGGQGRGVVDDVLVGALGQGDGGGGVDDLLGQDAGGEGVVDAEDGVAERGVLGQHQLVDELAAVPGGRDLEGVARVLLEGGDEVVGHGEGVVGDDGDGGVSSCPFMCA